MQGPDGLTFFGTPVWAYCQNPTCGLVSDIKLPLEIRCPRCLQYSLAHDEGRTIDENTEAIFEEHDV